MTCCVVQVDNFDCALIVYVSALYNYFVAVVVWLIQLLEINKVTIKTWLLVSLYYWMKLKGALSQTYFQTVVFQKHAANLRYMNKLVHIHTDVKNILSCFVWECHPLSFSNFRFSEDAGLTCSLPFTVYTVKIALLTFINLSFGQCVKSNMLECMV